MSLEHLDRLGDGAAASQEGLAEIGDALPGRIAHSQIPQEPTGHGGETVLVRVEAPRVIREGQLSVSGHAPDTT